MMKVLTLAPYKFIPAENGGQKAIEGLYNSLSRHVELTCVSTHNNDLSKDHGFELLPLFNTSKFRYADIFSVFSLARFIKNRGITHLIIEHPYMGWMALQLKKRTGVKLIVHSHNIEGERFKSMGKWWAKYLARYEKYIHQKADLSLFITQQDLEYSIKEFGLKKETTLVVPFAVNLNSSPSAEEKSRTKQLLCERHAIDSEKKILIYAGAFNYAPNAEGLDHLLHSIVPILNNKGFNYHLLICGKDIPKHLVKTTANITYTGFVENIHDYYCGSDVFVNPIISGGGIKTKLVEALGNNCNAVSTRTGAIGVPVDLAGSKMITVGDNDWENFATAIINSGSTHNTPPAFYDYFNGDKIAERIVLKMENIT